MRADQRDGDGLENSVDPDPEVAGPDAHGTNAEWYNSVCSNVVTAVEGGGAMGASTPVLSWPEDVNSNAYYFVDIVGCEVLDENGQVLGIVSQVEEFPAQLTF